MNWTIHPMSLFGEVLSRARPRTAPLSLAGDAVDCCVDHGRGPRLLRLEESPEATFTGQQARRRPRDAPRRRPRVAPGNAQGANRILSPVPRLQFLRQEPNGVIKSQRRRPLEQRRGHLAARVRGGQRTVGLLVTPRETEGEAEARLGVGEKRIAASAASSPVFAKGLPAGGLLDLAAPDLGSFPPLRRRSTAACGKAAPSRLRTAARERAPGRVVAEIARSRWGIDPAGLGREHRPVASARLARPAIRPFFATAASLGFCGVRWPWLLKSLGKPWRLSSGTGGSR
jgi:hypothetical protein